VIGQFASRGGGCSHEAAGVSYLTDLVLMPWTVSSDEPDCDRRGGGTEKGALR